MRKAAYKVAASVRRLYWFVFRPRTSGVKCVIEHEGRWLMIRNTYGRGHWTFPGGAVSRGEQARDAAKREVLEEVGIELSDVRPIGEYFTDKEYKRDTVYCFSATATSADHVIDRGEIAEAMWVPVEALPDFRAPSVDRIRAMLRSQTEPDQRPNT